MTPSNGGHQRTVAITALGCKLNQAEAEALARRFGDAGYRLVDVEDGADIALLNTCTVTHMADRKSRQALRRARRANPGATVVATGCYAQRAPAEIEAMPEVDLVVDNVSKMRIPELLGIEAEGSVEAGVRTGRTRSMVKIQEGCNQVCAYCIVPKTRGRERSMPLDDLVGQVSARVGDGYREVVLTGTQLGSYGHELGDNPDGVPWYETLVRRILAETGVERLRFSSLQPQEITPGMMELYASGRLCPHVHMPLQSGSDAVLKRMRRRYDTACYGETAARLREAAPGIAITTDMIVGFPGETEEDFEAGLRFAKGMAFTAIHVFPYSHRPGTSAAYFRDHVGSEAKRARERRLLRLAEASGQAYRSSFVGRRARVLWEERKERDGEAVWTGLTEHYVRAYTRSHLSLTNEIAAVEVIGAGDGGLDVRLASSGASSAGPH